MMVKVKVKASAVGKHADIIGLCMLAHICEYVEPLGGASAKRHARRI